MPLENLAGADEVEIENISGRDTGSDRGRDDGAGGGAADERKGFTSETTGGAFELGQSNRRDYATYAATVYR